MKRLILTLIFGVGLVGVANAEVANGKSVCENVDMGEVYYYEYEVKAIGRFFYESKKPSDDFDYDAIYNSNPYKAHRDIFKLLGAHYHYTEIKRSDKESICAYKLTFDYLKTQITEQELERFERFTAENDKYDWYNENISRGDVEMKRKDIMLYALKFIKFQNKTEELIYKNKNTHLLYDLYKIAEYLDGLATKISIAKFIYGKRQSGYVYTDISATGTTIGQHIKTLKGTAMDYEDWEDKRNSVNELKAIIKWAESIK